MRLYNYLHPLIVHIHQGTTCYIQVTYTYRRHPCVARGTLRQRRRYLGAANQISESVYDITDWL